MSINNNQSLYAKRYLTSGLAAYFFKAFVFTTVATTAYAFFVDDTLPFIALFINVAFIPAWYLTGYVTYLLYRYNLSVQSRKTMICVTLFVLFNIEFFAGYTLVFSSRSLDLFMIFLAFPAVAVAYIPVWIFKLPEPLNLPTVRYED